MCPAGSRPNDALVDLSKWSCSRRTKLWPRTRTLCAGMTPDIIGGGAGGGSWRTAMQHVRTCNRCATPQAAQHYHSQAANVDTISWEIGQNTGKKLRLIEVSESTWKSERTKDAEAECAPSRLRTTCSILHHQGARIRKMYFPVPTKYVFNFIYI